LGLVTCVIGSDRNPVSKKKPSGSFFTVPPVFDRKTLFQNGFFRPCFQLLRKFLTQGTGFSTPPPLPPTHAFVLVVWPPEFTMQ